ncbi:MAG: diguanylate cyclase [Pseudoxanthomonas sp.]|nr:diguanylate cyclase [Pseudoxanthomonas sp.]
MAALVGLLDWLLLYFSRGPGELAAAWFGNGFLVGWLLSRPTRLWRWYLLAGLLAGLLARLLSASPPMLAVALAGADIVEVMIVAVAVRRKVPNIRDPRRWIELGGVATTSTLLACAVSGVLAAAAFTLIGGGRFLSGFISWYAAHVLGMVIFGTATLVAHREGRALFTAPGRRWSFAATMLLVVAVSTVVFWLPYPVLFLAYPPLLLAAFRHGFAGVAISILLFGLIGSVATAMDLGPIMLVDGFGRSGRVAVLQLYIAGACLMTIPVALVMNERRRLNARLRDSEQRFRMLADYSHDVIVRMSAEGVRLYVSPSARDLLGWSPDEMLGMRWSLVHPDDRARQQQAMAAVLANGQPHTEVYRIRHKDGHYVWIEAVTRPIPSIDGDGMDIIYSGRDVSSRVAAEAALEASRRELERQVRVDALTGLANRRRFEEGLDLALMRLRRHGTPLALMYLDVDYFKRINDTRGHAVGDQVLCAFARRLADSVRATDLVVRLGGDEFAVVIEDARLPDAAEAVARKLVAEMREGIDIDGTAVVATTSIGIGYTDTPTDAVTLKAVADAALYEAKRAGRNTWRIRPVTPVVER